MHKGKQRGNAFAGICHVSIVLSRLFTVSVITKIQLLHSTSIYSSHYIHIQSIEKEHDTVLFIHIV